MPLRQCLACGRYNQAGAPCPRCRNRNNPARGSGGKRATFRKRTLATTGGRCAVVTCCTPFDRVQAHHVHALADGGDPEGPGLPLCFTHHRYATASEAVKRRKRR